MIKTYGNLVSDDNLLGANILTNKGISLPNNPDGTHNPGFSPFFLVGSGYAYSLIYITNSRGYTGNTLYSSVSSYHSQTVSNIYIGSITSPDVLPSHAWESYVAFPLRCLVSTNNGLMNKEIGSDSDSDFSPDSHLDFSYSSALTLTLILYSHHY